MFFSCAQVASYACGMKGPFYHGRKGLFYNMEHQQGMKRERIYLDWAASAPLRPEAREALLAALDQVGNPSARHSEGQAVRRIVERARSEVAALAGAEPRQVIFTSGATEANALALASADVVFAGRGEHPSLVRHGRRVVALPRKAVERVDPDATNFSLPLMGSDEVTKTVLAFSLVHNETGVIRTPAGLTQELSAEPVCDGKLQLHMDASQAAGKLPLSFGEIATLGVTTMTLSSHKLGGPKGVGALVVADPREVVPLIRGGGQERNLRSGTENVSAIAGFGVAATLAWREAEDHRHRMRMTEVGRVLAAGVMARFPNAWRLGVHKKRGRAEDLAVTRAVPEIQTWYLGHARDPLVVAFDLAGVAVGSGSACASGREEVSPVLQAMGLSEMETLETLRFSFGWGTTTTDVREALNRLSSF